MKWREKARAAGIHLGISVVLGALAAVLVFMVWYPYPYREISGGRSLFLLLVIVDVVLGPLLTFVIFNSAKPRTELVRDVGMIGLVQLAALAYGLWTVFEARPVHTVFEYNRFRVVHASDLPADVRDKTPRGIVALPITGPELLALRPLQGSRETLEYTAQALEGWPLSARPELWRPYESARHDVMLTAQPAAQLLARFPERRADIEQIVTKTGVGLESVFYLPLLGRDAQAWTVFLVGSDARIVGYLPLDPF